MKVIDLINKASKGEDMPKKIKVEHWGYTFEWIERLNNYHDENADIDLMSALSMDEELNYEVYVLDGKKIKKIKDDYFERAGTEYKKTILKDKINEIIDYINERN